jgi:SAM-dependent MidA family methyltransferase
MKLPERLVGMIAADGAISVSRYMDLCLHDPEDGYYATRPRLGADGDFITAPHVSQMFGELLGLWAADVWARLGAPARVRLVEIGPGDATLIGDVLRAARAAPGFLAACEVRLIETSAPLRDLQRRTLADAAVPISWADTVETSPTDAPLIILANEFLDCLPIDQAVRTDEGWRERRIGVDRWGNLEFQLGETLPALEGEGGCVTVSEYSPALAGMGRTIGALVSRATGAALFIDYGRAAPGYGDTLQALRGHRKEGPLENPGGADLTAHVDFPAFAAAAAAAGADVSPILTQRDFLRALGIELRAAALTAARPDRAQTIARQLRRLIDPAEMGALFKVVCVSSRGLAAPGFEAAA